MSCALFALPVVAGAQPSADDKAAAAEAFDRGTAKWLGKDYAQAAGYFETAHRLAPAAAALVQAVRSHERAGNDLRAATLALQLAGTYPDDALARKTARAVLASREKKYARIDVKCEDCTIELDGKLVDHPSFFVEPARTVSLEAGFATGSVQRDVEGRAGETLEVSFEAPPKKEAPPPPPDPAGAGAATGAQPAVAEPAVPWVVPAVLGGLTVVAGGVLTWSGLDTLDERDAYEAAPTRARFEHGRDLELRTNVLIAATAVLGAATLTTTFFALPRAEPSRDGAALDATLSVGPGVAATSIRGSF